jgi:hypothetical protein
MKKHILLDPYLHGTLMRDLVGHDHKPAAFLVYFWLYAEQERLDQPIAASHSRLAEETGLSRSTSQAAVAWLVRRKLLLVQKEAVTATPVYSVERPWQR